MLGGGQVNLDDIATGRTTQAVGSSAWGGLGTYLLLIVIFCCLPGIAAFCFFQEKLLAIPVISQLALALGLEREQARPPRGPRTPGKRLQTLAKALPKGPRKRPPALRTPARVPRKGPRRRRTALRTRAKVRRRPRPRSRP